MAATDDSDVNSINLNCKQCRIYSVVFNGVHEAEFDYYDPALSQPEDATRRDLQTFLAQQEQAAIATDADEGNGELNIIVPESLRADFKSNYILLFFQTFFYFEIQNYSFSDSKSLKLAIEFYLENPHGGLQFLSTPYRKAFPTSHADAGSMSNIDSALVTISHKAHYWFPCLLSHSAMCTWKIEVTVSRGLSAIASGRLIEVEYIKEEQRPSINNDEVYEIDLMNPDANIKASKSRKPEKKGLYSLCFGKL